MAGVMDEVKERISIMDVVSPHVQLKKSGRSFKGLCPFHTEKTPSFYVFPDSGTFKCFGCGAGGDVFGFVMRTENLSFGDALRELADKAGVTLRARPEVEAEDRERAHLREVLAAAGTYYQNLLGRNAAAQAARAYLAKRGVTQASMESWQLGYALESWDALQTYLLTRGFTIEDLHAAGLVIQRDNQRGFYDRFRNRIMFPIRDERGLPIGFGARAMGDDQPKYMNSPQSILFDKSATLYGIDRARDGIRQADQAVIVEGYMDVLIPHQMGITNIVASLGTALTARHMAVLNRLTKRLVLALDADAAGDEATLRGLEVARDVLDREAVPVPTGTGLIRFEHVMQNDIRILSLPRGKDPDEVVLADPQEWKRLVAEALPVVDFYFKVATANLDLHNARDKAQAADRLLPVINEIVDGVVRSHYLQKLAGLLQVDERALAGRLRAAGRQPARATGGKPAAAVPATPARVVSPKHSLDTHCLALLLYEPALYWRVQDLALSADDFPATENRELFTGYQAYMKEHDAFDLAGFRETVDPSLHGNLDALVQIGEIQPLLSAEDLENALIVTILRNREQRLKKELTELPFLLRSARDDGEDGDVSTLTNRVDMLRDEVRHVQRALNERTVLWRTKGDR